jgi:hypothetical protein
MSRSASARKMPARPTLANREGALLFALANHEAPKPCNPPLVLSPGFCVLAWRVPRTNAMHGKLWMTHSLLSVAGKYGGRQNRNPCCQVVPASLYMPFIHGEFSESAISPGFPHVSLGHSLGAFPAPGGNCAALLRPCGRPRVSAFRKSFVQRTQKDFPNLPKKTPLDLGSGAPRVTSCRSVPSKNRANPNRRKSNGTL